MTYNLQNYRELVKNHIWASDKIETFWSDYDKKKRF